MASRKEVPQWFLTCAVTHDPHYHHRLYLFRQLRGKKAELLGMWTWKGVGVDQEVLEEVRCNLDTELMDHLDSVYGIRPTVKDDQGGPPDAS